MADIDYHCPQCGRARKLSEYADPSGITCPACKVPYTVGRAGQGTGPVAPPPTPPGPRKRPSLKLKRKPPEPPPTPPEPPDGHGKRKPKAKVAKRPTSTLPDDVTKADDEVDDEQPVQRAYVKEERRPASHTWLAWLLFAVIGGVLWGCRYGGWLPPELLGWMSAYGWIVVVAFHILIVLKAMTDNMLQGVLALLVPGYTLYYIFVVSDDFFLRAVFAGLLVGMGLDAAEELNMRAQRIMSTAHRFIEEGGGDIR